MSRLFQATVLLAGVSVVSLAIAAGAAARSATYVEIKLGDQVRIAGTRTICLATKDDATGKPGIGCALFAGGAPITGSYAPSLTADGKIEVERITKNGATTVFKRTLQGVGAASKTYVLRSGDQFALPVGGDKAVGCSVLAIGGFVGPVCSYATQKGPVANSYGFFVSGQQAAVVRYDGRGKSSSPVKRFQQPH